MPARGKVILQIAGSHVKSYLRRLAWTQLSKTVLRYLDNKNFFKAPILPRVKLLDFKEHTLFI